MASWRQDQRPRRVGFWESAGELGGMGYLCGLLIGSLISILGLNIFEWSLLPIVLVGLGFPLVGFLGGTFLGMGSGGR